MSRITIDNITNSIDRYKLFYLTCHENQLQDVIDSLGKCKINSVNIGKELAMYIEELDDYAYLPIDVYDFLKRTLDDRKSKVSESGNDVVAIYNLGILFEPRLELNAVQLLRDFSKSSGLILLWPYEIEDAVKLRWYTQGNSIYFDFTETPLKQLHYAI